MSPTHGLTISMRTVDGDSVFFAETFDTVTVAVAFNSGDETVTGIEVFLAYDPTLFLPVDTDTSTPGIQPVQTSGGFGQVFADSIIVANGMTSVIHYAEVDLIGSKLDGVVFTVQFKVIGNATGSSSIKVLQTPAFKSLYTLTARDGETVIIPSMVGVTHQDLPPVLGDASTFTIEEDGGPAVLLSGLVTDESPLSALTFSVAMEDSMTTVEVVGDSLRFITPRDYTGKLTGQLIVRDPGGGEDTAPITLTVTPVNDAPEIDASAFIDTVTVGDQPLTIELTGSDVDDDSKTLFWFGLVTEDSLNARTEGSTLTLTAVSGWNGSATITIQLADPGGLVDTLPIVVVGAVVVGDFDGSGGVDFGDFLRFAEAFGDPDADRKFDLDGSGAVDFPDFLIFAENFGS